jgi:hypothetical protein
MIIQDRSFPHPVLAPFRDDVTPNQFSIGLTIKSLFGNRKCGHFNFNVVLLREVG